MECVGVGACQQSNGHMIKLVYVFILQVYVVQNATPFTHLSLPNCRSESNNDLIQ